MNLVFDKEEQNVKISDKGVHFWAVAPFLHSFEILGGESHIDMVYVHVPASWVFSQNLV